MTRMRLLERTEKITRGVSSVTSALGIALLGSVGVLLVTGVILRAFGRALSGAFDLVQILIVGAVAFAFVDCELKNRHAKAEVLVDRMKPRPRAWVDGFTTLCALFYWLVVLLSSWQIALRKFAEGEETDMLKVPIAPFRAVWLFGLVLLCVIVCTKLVRHVRRGIGIDPRSGARPEAGGQQAGASK